MHHRLRLLIEYLSEETDAERIHIVGYSAGSRVVLEALFQLTLTGDGEGAGFFRGTFRLGNVILVGLPAGGDCGINCVRKQAPGITPVASMFPSTPQLTRVRARCETSKRNERT